MNNAGFKLRSVSRDEWDLAISKARTLFFNEQIALVEAVSDIYACSPKYFLYEYKGSLVASLIAYTKGEKLISPIHFYYSSFWVTPLTDIKYMEYISEFVEQLTNEFTDITLRLPPQITDVRPFLWNGFTVQNNYTYIKRLDELLTYSSSTQRNLNNFDQTSFSFKVSTLDDTSINLNIKIFKSLNLLPAKIDRLKNLLFEMSRLGVLRCFNAFKDNEMLASMHVFLDERSHQAYLILLNQTSNAKKSNVHTKLHQFMFEYLQNAGYHQVDLMGGDLKGISAYKTSLNTELKPHFTVTYSKKSRLLSQLKSKAIQRLKWLLAKF
jgi:hypothetical protein